MIMHAKEELVGRYVRITRGGWGQSPTDIGLEKQVSSVTGADDPDTGPKINLTDGSYCYGRACELLPRVAQDNIKDANKPTSALDTQEGGDHYKSRAIQPIEYCVKNKLGACESAIIKYATRWRDKNGLEDLKKIKHYVDLLIELEDLDNDCTN